MASGRFPSVWETHFQGQEARGEKTDSEGSAAVDLQDGYRESDLGSSTHPWRASDARRRCFRANDICWMKRAPKGAEPAKRWQTFLRNHREAIAAMDFFTVPTITFGVLYCFFIIGHDRRRILHCNVTKHPTSL